MALMNDGVSATTSGSNEINSGKSGGVSDLSGVTATLLNAFTNTPNNSLMLTDANFSGMDTNANNTVTDSTIPSWTLTVYSQEHLIVTSIILGLFVLFCIIGNCFVIAAVILERSLHNVANYLILSLAVADLMVAVLVMPLSVVSEISQVWFLHQEICDVWISVDVLCCTASILHLDAIAMDRYLAVTSIDYIRRRSARRIILMIVVVWIVALFISIPPLFGWRDPRNDPDITGQCIISQDKGYTIFSTVGAFYLPMLVMIIIYAKIYQVARARIRKDKFQKVRIKVKTEETTLVASPKTEYTMVSDCNGCGSPAIDNKKKRRAPFKSYGCSPRPERKKRGNLKSGSSESNGLNNSREGMDTLKQITIEPDAFTNGCNDESTIAMLEKQSATNGKKISTSDNHNLNRTREKLELKRERKAARTLAIITGAFIICWLPFFIIALVGPFVEDENTQIPPFARSFVLWLGYFNSLLNPIIYTIFSPEFRSAFQKILFGKYRRRGR